MFRPGGCFSGEGAILCQIGFIRAGNLNFPVGMAADDRGGALYEKAVLGGQIGKLQQRVVEIPVSVGDGDQAGSLVSADVQKTFPGQSRDAAAVDGRAEKNQVFPVKGARRGMAGDAASPPVAE